MKSVDVAAGTIEYREEGDPDGPPVVLLHGRADERHASGISMLPLLPADYRYLLPVLPLGGHRVPMRADADLTMPGMVGIVADFLDALDLTDVDAGRVPTGAARSSSPTWAATSASARMVICPSEAFENFPPGFPGKVTWLATRTPGPSRWRCGNCGSAGCASGI